MVASLGPLELLVRLTTHPLSNVYVARDTSQSGRIVVVKVLHPGISGSDALRFADEARLLCRLDHPNLVCVTGHGQIAGISAMEMEFVLGFNLETTLAAAINVRRPLPVEIILRIVSAACRGLHCAHELKDDKGRPTNLVHRDVTSANVLVAFNGESKLTDFGLASSNDRGWVTEVHSLPSRKSFRALAPEQLISSQVDRRADVFAVGVMLWECLVGRTLFEGVTLRDLHRAVTVDPIARPSRAAPGVPAGIDALVMRALERDAANRQQTAAELADEIDDLLRKSRRTVDASDVAVTLAQAFGERIPRLARALRATMAGRSNEKELADLCGGTVVPPGELDPPELLTPPAFYDDDAEATIRSPLPPARSAAVYDDPPTMFAGAIGPAPPPPRAEKKGWNQTMVRSLSAEALNEILGTDKGRTR